MSFLLASIFLSFLNCLSITADAHIADFMCIDFALDGGVDKDSLKWKSSCVPSKSNRHLNLHT